MQDLIMSIMLRSSYLNWVPHSWTSLMKSSMSMLSGSKVKLFQALCKWVRDLPCVEKYLEKSFMSFSQLKSGVLLDHMSANHSLAEESRVCLKFFSFALSVSTPMASYQSKVHNRWASGLSPGSPLNIGGFILLIALRVFFSAFRSTWALSFWASHLR